MSSISSELNSNKSNSFANYINNNFTKTRLLIYSSAFIIRLLFIAYSFYHNLIYDIKYSDIDYIVYSDAANHVLSNKSPYLRYTYRYTPLLALCMVFNDLFFHDFGKILFSISDIFVGYYIDKSLKLCSELKRLLLTSLWLFNPFVIGISTRGSSDTFICLLVICTLYYHLNGHYIISSLIFGLSVHFKLYPVMYSVPFLFYLYSDRTVRKLKSNYYKPFKLLFKLPYLLVVKLKFKHVLFGLFSFIVFVFLGYTSYYIYGFESLFETYLYHYVRKDHRHNFSIYFNLMYYIVDKNVNLNFIISFVPQMFTAAIFSFVAFIDLPLSLFLMTLSFVVLNKVITSQYFLWWMCLLPFVFNKISYTLESLKSILLSTLSMFIFKFLWLFWSFRQEHLGHNSFNEMLFSSTFLFISKMFLLWSILYESALFNKPIVVEDKDDDKNKSNGSRPNNNFHLNHIFNPSGLKFDHFANVASKYYEQNADIINQYNKTQPSHDMLFSDDKTTTIFNNTNNNNSSSNTNNITTNTNNNNSNGSSSACNHDYDADFTSSNDLNHHNHSHNDDCNSHGHHSSCNHGHDYDHSHNHTNSDNSNKILDISDFFKPLLVSDFVNSSSGNKNTNYSCTTNDHNDCKMNFDNNNNTNGNNWCVNKYNCYNENGENLELSENDQMTDRSVLGDLKSLNNNKGVDLYDQTDLSQSTEDTVDVYDVYQL